MKSIIRWFFLTKNHFVLLVFISYILAILAFSLAYQYLIQLDSGNRSRTIPHFIINQDIMTEKIRQNKFDILAAIEVDSLNLTTIKNQQTAIYKKIPLQLLSKTADQINEQFYLSGAIITQLRTMVGAYRWDSLLVLPGKAGSVDLVNRRSLMATVNFEHHLHVSRSGELESLIFVTDGPDSLLISYDQLGSQNAFPTAYLRYGRYDLLINWILKRYKYVLMLQVKHVIDYPHPIGSYQLQEYYQISEKKKQLIESLTNSRHVLMGMNKPNWAYRDVVFFTVVSLFANNYSDIYPNSTWARTLIMVEFLVVWFLTICAISLEPDKFGFVRRWNSKKEVDNQ